MFTGIIEEKGKLLNKHLQGSSSFIKIGASKVLEGTRIGDSIAVNGVCLTVTAMDDSSFTADVMPETLRRTNLGDLYSMAEVNLERAMAADGRFGGHIVSGHIDGTGTIVSLVHEGNAVVVTIEAKPEILDLIIEKGSICIDGISLTVVAVTKDSFSVSVIPHTGSETTLLDKKRGDKVNLENDVIAKYVQKLLGASKGTGITMDFLAEHGF
jgi:riboflavin synthase